MARQTFIIGRAGDIKLYDDTVSRRHACLEIEDGMMFLRDLDSRNGTYEIRDKQLFPFTSGAIYADQVFAFGECVRSAAQLLQAVRELTGEGEEAPAAPAPDAESPLDATHVRLSVPPRPRLGPADIVEMLDRIEDARAEGASLEEACARVGIPVARYERWCREHGATRAERERTLAELAQENERLRKLVTDLSLEREALKEALVKMSAGEPENDAPARSFTLISDNKS